MLNRSTLNATIRALRARLLDGIRTGAETSYALALPLEKAGLDDATRIRRARLDAWLDEQLRTVTPSAKKNLDKRAWRAETRERFLAEAVKEAAYTLLNRLVILRVMEAHGLSSPAILTGGRRSDGYRQFREFAPALSEDRTEGFSTLLGLVWDELAIDLPGLYGDVGLTSLFPVPPHILLHAIEALDAPELADAWRDDTTLGWVYQYWNDPEREELDAKINKGGKIAPHEIASKTQLFTERYMVQWLLHNSLGQMWLAMCRKHGWVADVETPGNDGLSVLDRLEARRVDWRRRREAGEVALDALMPLDGDLEGHWKYYVPQPMPDDAPDHAPSSLRDLKLIDPACGSGHFLVLAFELLVSLYREEARHRDAAWSDAQIATWIVEDNLHGLDLDARAVQIAAASLWLKVRALALDAQPSRMNLVAADLRLADLPHDDPAVMELKGELRREVGLPGGVVNALLDALAGVDHLGSLLRPGDEVRRILEDFEAQQTVPRRAQIHLFGAPQKRQLDLDVEAQRLSVIEAVERFLARHRDHAALGLRLRGAQLSSGVQLVRLLTEGHYDLVIGNPPYQGASKMEDASYMQSRYPAGKADLYAAFMLRAMELCKHGGMSALLTMRNWMFLKQYEELRTTVLHTKDLRVLGDVDRGAFEEILDEVVAAVMSVIRRVRPAALDSAVMRPTSLEDNARDKQRTARKKAALLAGVGRFTFDVRGLAAVDGEPVVYWWESSFLREWATYSSLGATAPARQGLITGDNVRFVRAAWEVGPNSHCESWEQSTNSPWAYYIMGAAGQRWFDAIASKVRWYNAGMEIRTLERGGRIASRPQNLPFYFVRGCAFATIGSQFGARVHRTSGVFADVGASFFGANPTRVACVLNATSSRKIASDLNPTVHFTIGDVNRLPLVEIQSADGIYARLNEAFTEHESHREASVEFRHPGQSCWEWAQDWAQRAVDRPSGTPLPLWDATYVDPAATDHISYAFGVAMGRFGAEGQGTLDAEGRPCRLVPPPLDGDDSVTPPRAVEPGPPVTQGMLSHGILYLSATGADDSLANPACAPLHDTWREHGPAIARGKDVRTWLQRTFFDAVHRPMYDNRPIYLPLSSERRTFVAWVSIHRFGDQTLPALLADHLVPERRALQGRLADALEQRGADDASARRSAEKAYAQVSGWLDELDAFIATITDIADRGPPSPDAKTPVREADARFSLDLNDGVMVNSAAMWPLLLPQWKKPRQWWKELAAGKGRKDYDWSHMAARYFPARVDAKCRRDPSLAVAHGCFWRYHPAKAFAWELRLQDEIGLDFVLEEADSDSCRSRFMEEQTEQGLAAVEKEALRRAKKLDGGRKLVRMALPLSRLWTIAPEAVYALERKLRQKKRKKVSLFDRGFVLVEPNADAARDAIAETRGVTDRQTGIGL